MTNKFFIFCISLFALWGAQIPSYAQDCTVLAEIIHDFSSPTTGSYNVWDAEYGEKDLDEAFSSGLLLRNGNVLTAGTSAKGKFSTPTLILAELDRRGRTVWSIREEVPDLLRVVRVVEHDNGALVLADVKKSVGSYQTKLWLGFFDAKGAKLKQEVIVLEDEGLEGLDIIPRIDSSGYIMTAFVKKPGGRRGYTKVYVLSSEGKVEKDRSFVPGLENKLLKISPYGEKNYIAAGFLRSGDGRQVGWIVRMNEVGQIIWERQFPRGRAAQINAVKGFLMNYIVLGGDTIPYGQGNIAGWLMVVDGESGNLGWQRFYRGDYDYSVRDVLADRNGLMTAMLTGTPLKREKKKNEKEEKYEYVRLLTINPRGQLFISDEYLYGKGARADSLIFGPKKERIMIGSTTVSYQVKDENTGEVIGDEKKEQGWITAATAMENYSDPCSGSGSSYNR